MTGFGTPEPERREPPVYECRTCDDRTHDPRRICPDCRYEGAGRDRFRNRRRGEGAK